MKNVLRRHWIFHWLATVFAAQTAVSQLLFKVIMESLNHINYPGYEKQFKQKRIK